jgi:hypothetical protein
MSAKEFANNTKCCFFPPYDFWDASQVTKITLTVYRVLL